MKNLLLGFLVGLATGAGGFWYIEHIQHRDAVQFAGEQIATGAKKAKETMVATFRELSIEQLKDELARTGMIVREKARSAGVAISGAAANARTTAAIKTKLLQEPGLSALQINVDTTDGFVTLSGAVNSHEEIAKAVRLALDTEGVIKVVSTLQVKAVK